MHKVRRHINPANILALVALVFAVTGGAYAASNGGNGGGGARASALVAHATTAKKSKKKSSSSVGKPGPRGPAGPAGSQGPAGPAGAKGENGANGSNGSNGEPGKNGENGHEGKAGANGTSVTNTPLAKGNGSGNCEEGGAEFKVGGGAATYACNGSATAGGGEGYPETLPEKKTEKGTWTMGTVTGTPGTVSVPVSFPIPLPAGSSGHSALTKHKVHFILPDKKEALEGSEEEQSVCLGSAEEPTAESGNLCIYVTTLEDVKELETEVADPEHGATRGAGTAGAMIFFYGATEGAFGYGTWAVTAPEAP